MLTKQSAVQHLSNRFSQDDPWHYGTSEYEKARFDAMLAMVKSVPHTSILEVGSAEGHFTQMLTTISQDVTGIDIIPAAIKRAQKRAPQAKFVEAAIEDFLPEKLYDVVVFADVIYYIPDKRKALDVAQRSGRVLITGNNILMGWRPNTGDRYFWRFPLLRRSLVWKEGKLCLISLRELQ